MTNVSAVSEKKHKLPLILAIFLLSVFAGILLRAVISQWINLNIDVLKKNQVEKETQRLNNLLEKINP